MEKPENKTKQRQFKQIIFSNFPTYSFANNSVSLNEFLDFIKQSVPEQSKDTATISVDQSSYYDDATFECELGWDEIIDNPHYEKELKKYNKWLNKQSQGNAKIGLNAAEHSTLVSFKNAVQFYTRINPFDPNKINDLVSLVLQNHKKSGSNNSLFIKIVSSFKNLSEQEVKVACEKLKKDLMNSDYSKYQ